jgi:predicted RNase H-related nuclease YkuK (DUF458 family)
MFKKFNGENIEDVAKYVKNYVENHKNIDVIVATDSQSYGDKTKFSTVIVMYDKGTDGHGHGGHCIAKRWYTERYPKYMRDSRLLCEVEESIKVAKCLRDGKVKVAYVDIDINPSKKAGSNSVFASACAMVSEAKFECRWKTVAPLATATADHIVKQRSHKERKIPRKTLKKKK